MILTENIGLLGYSTSGISYLIFIVLLLVSWRGRLEGGLLINAILFQLFWSLSLALNFYGYLDSRWLFLVEVLRDVAWIVFFYCLLPIHAKKIKRYLNVSVYGGGLTVIGFATYVAADEMFFINETLLKAIIFVSLSMSVVVLVLIEQLFRNVVPDKRWTIKYLCISVGAIFVFDLYMYADAALFGGADMNLWVTRGFVNALAVPLLAISVARQKKLSLEIFVSRHVVFYSASVLIVGVYLVLMALGGFYVKSFDGAWSAVAQVVFLAVAIIAMAIILTSEKSRAKFKVFMTKHFYKNRYDYREEWLRLIHNLADYSSYDRFKEQIIQSIAVLIYSRGGVLYLDDESELRPTTYWGVSDNLPVIAINSSLPVFLNKSDWIINVPEYEQQPEKYKGLQLNQEIQDMDDVWLIVPLKHHYQLIGFVILLKSTILDELTWEDRDLLKAVSRQISSYLAFIRTTEELNRAQQFNTFNRLSAFIVHDLKNQISQLDLIVKNATKFRDNQDFINDTFLTVENVVSRMQRLLGQLKQVNQETSEARKVLVEQVIAEVVMLCALESPAPVFQHAEESASVLVDPERFKNILENLIKNAQEATEPGGRVEVNLENQADDIVIIIKDNGCGMASFFMQEKLFKPFYTTKGNAGMGIGAFEAKEFVKHYGGSLTVSSKPGEGSEFVIRLPKAV